MRGTEKYLLILSNAVTHTFNSNIQEELKAVRLPQAPKAWPRIRPCPETDRDQAELIIASVHLKWPLFSSLRRNCKYGTVIIS